MNSKKTLFIFSAVVLGAAVSLQVFAQTGNAKPFENQDSQLGNKREEARAEIQNKFCEGITDLISKIGQRFSERKNKIQEKNQERLNKWEEKTSDRDAKLASLRTKRDINLENNFELLEKRAQTEEQKEAVSDFEKKVKEAIETRRDAMDAAMEAFRNGVKELHETRKGFVETGSGSLEEAGKAALEKAKEDCANGKTPATVRQSLRSALQIGKNKFSSEKQNLEKMRTQMKALIQTRNAAFEKAKSDFHNTMEQLRVEFKKAFSDEEESENSEE